MSNTRLIRNVLSCAAAACLCVTLDAQESAAQEFLPPIRTDRPIEDAPMASADKPQTDGWIPTTNESPEAAASAVATVTDSTPALESDTSSIKSDVPVAGPTPLDDSDLKLNPSVPLEEKLQKIFAINDSAISWTLRGNETNGIGFFSLENPPNQELQLDVRSNFDINFRAGIHWISGPGRTDAPPRVYDFSWTVHLRTDEMFQIGLPGGDVGVRVDALFDLGIHSDFEDSAREGWRYPGRVLLTGDTGDDWLRFVAGFELLDLDHIQMLPAAGIVLADDDTLLELYFPRPRLKWRVEEYDKSEEWAYLLGEYRGRAWAIERTTGNEDVMTLSEYRLALGIETQPKPNSKKDDDQDDDDREVSFLEFNWLFGRDLEYRTRIGNYQPGDTFMLRWGTRY